MSSELKKRKPIICKRLNWAFTAPPDIVNEMREYAKKYDMSLGQYIEAIHKRYVESIETEK